MMTINRAALVAASLLVSTTWTTTSMAASAAEEEIQNPQYYLVALTEMVSDGQFFLNQHVDIVHHFYESPYYHAFRDKNVNTSSCEQQQQVYNSLSEKDAQRICAIYDSLSNKEACEYTKSIILPDFEKTPERQSFYNRMRRGGFYGEIHSLLMCWTDPEWQTAFYHARLCEMRDLYCDKLPF